MKKFSEWIGMVREAELREQSDLQKSYQDYFKGKLDKFGAKSPADLSDEQKKEFFNEISKEWEKGKGVKEEFYIKEGEVKVEAPKGTEAGGDNAKATDKIKLDPKEGGVKKADEPADEEKSGEVAKAEPAGNPQEGAVKKASAPKEGEAGGDNFKGTDSADTHAK
jgi:hypothetical protein